MPRGGRHEAVRRRDLLDRILAEPKLAQDERFLLRMMIGGGALDASLHALHAEHVDEEAHELVGAVAERLRARPHLTSCRDCGGVAARDAHVPRNPPQTVPSPARWVHSPCMQDARVR